MRSTREDGMDWVRWLMFALGLALVAFLAATLETGKAHALGSVFSFRGSIVRFITPNNDGKNDVGILCYENPNASAPDAKVMDLRGNEVSGMTRWDAGATMTSCQNKYGLGVDAEALTWDGRSHGRAVAGGVYIYQVRSEGVTVTGTFVVVR